MGEELLGVFFLVDSKGVIHIPKKDPWGLGRCLGLWLQNLP